MQGPFVQQRCSEDAVVGQRAQPLCLRVEGQRNGKDDRSREGNVLVLMWQRHGTTSWAGMPWHLCPYPDEPGKLHLHLLAFCRVNFHKGIFFDMVLMGLVLGWWCFLVHQDLVQLKPDAGVFDP